MVKFDLIPLWVKIAALSVALVAAGGYGFYLGGEWKQAEWNEEKLAILEAHNKKVKELQDKNREVSADLQEALQNVRVEYKYVTDTVYTEVEKPVYKNCKIPASGAQVLDNNAKRLNALRK